SLSLTAVRSSSSSSSVKSSAASVSSINNNNNNNGTGVVWYKNDLRVDDHQGLIAAAQQQHKMIVPIYVFDHRILRRIAPAFSLLFKASQIFFENSHLKRSTVRISLADTLTLMVPTVDFTQEMLELLLFALEDLRNSLKDLGSDLMIRFGRTETVIQDLVKEVVTFINFLTKINFLTQIVKPQLRVPNNS
ncbi:pheophytinase, chloroplastic, partial [Tanacetum coccineum]